MIMIQPNISMIKIYILVTIDAQVALTGIQNFRNVPCPSIVTDFTYKNVIVN